MIPKSSLSSCCKPQKCFSYSFCCCSIWLSEEVAFRGSLSQAPMGCRELARGSGLSRTLAFACSHPQGNKQNVHWWRLSTKLFRGGHAAHGWRPDSSILTALQTENLFALPSPPRGGWLSNKLRTKTSIPLFNQTLAEHPSCTRNSALRALTLGLVRGASKGKSPFSGFGSLWAIITGILRYCRANGTTPVGPPFFT